MNVNPERVYYNYGGQFPPVTLEPERLPYSASLVGRKREELHRVGGL